MTTARSVLRTVKATSAGGVVYRAAESGRAVEVVLCGRTRESLWALPKGTPLPDESLSETALREVREETGLGVRIVCELGTIEYTFMRSGTRCEKTVHYFLMTADGTGATEQHDGEYDRVEWFAAGDALRVLTYDNERDALRRAIAAIDEGVTA